MGQTIIMILNQTTMFIYLAKIVVTYQITISLYHCVNSGYIDGKGMPRE